MKLPGRKEKTGQYYENSTQKWLPVENIRDGIIILKDGRYIKVIEVLPVNFYLKSEVEQETLIYYFASYLKIAPDHMQIRILTQKADITNYLERLEHYAQTEENESCQNMILDEIEFVRSLSDRVAVKKRFFLVYEVIQGVFGEKPLSFQEVRRVLEDEAYKAMKYLSQCGLEVLNVSDDGFLIDLFYGIINKHTARYVKPGNFAGSMFEEIHMFEGEKRDE